MPLFEEKTLQHGNSAAICARAFVAALASGCPYESVTEMLLRDNPVAHAAMRLSGVEERFVTGDGSDYEKLRFFCTVMGDMQQSVMARICAERLREILGVSCPIDAAHAEEIWNASAKKLCEKSITPLQLLECTGADTLYAAAEPWDDLSDFGAAQERAGCRVLPVFCPDALLSPRSAEFLPALRELERAFGEITDLQSLTVALERAVEHFAAFGATRAVHSVLPSAFVRPDPYHASLALQTCLGKGAPDADAAALLSVQIYRILGAAYLRCGLRAEFLTGGARPLQNLAISRPVSSVTDFSVLRALLGYLGEYRVLPQVALYVSSAAEAAEAVTLSTAFPTRLEGQPTLSLGAVGTAPDVQRDCLAVLSQGLPECAIVGVYPDLRLYPAFPIAERF